MMSPHAETVARYFIGVCRADTFACSAYLTFTHSSFAGSVEQAVCGHDKMSFLGYAQYAVKVYAVGFEVGGLTAEEYGVEHYAVAYYVCDRTFGENARGNRAEYVLVPVELKGVPGVGTALEAGHDVVVGSENVNNFTFTFVAPLEA